MQKGNIFKIVYKLEKINLHYHYKSFCLKKKKHSPPPFFISYDKEIDFSFYLFKMQVILKLVHLFKVKYCISPWVVYYLKLYKIIFHPPSKKKNQKTSCLFY